MTMFLAAKFGSLMIVGLAIFMTVMGLDRGSRNDNEDFMYWIWTSAFLTLGIGGFMLARQLDRPSKIRNQQRLS